MMLLVGLYPDLFSLEKEQGNPPFRGTLEEASLVLMLFVVNPFFFDFKVPPP